MRLVFVLHIFVCLISLPATLAAQTKDNGAEFQELLEHLKEWSGPQLCIEFETDIDEGPGGILSRLNKLIWRIGNEVIESEDKIRTAQEINFFNRTNIWMWLSLESVRMFEMMRPALNRALLPVEALAVGMALGEMLTEWVNTHSYTMNLGGERHEVTAAELWIGAQTIKEELTTRICCLCQNGRNRTYVEYARGWCNPERGINTQWFHDHCEDSSSKVGVGATTDR